MIIINIFIALIIAIGFWRNTSKEHKRMIAKASLTKTAILFLLSAAMTFFYYKSYQVATFDNSIVVEGIKGSYYVCDTTYKFFNGRDTIVKKIKCPRDSIKKINIYNVFQSYDFGHYSGIETFFRLDNNNEHIDWYSLGYCDNYPIDIKHLYNIEWIATVVPSLLPFSYNETITKRMYSPWRYDDEKRNNNWDNNYVNNEFNVSPYVSGLIDDNHFQHFKCEIMTKKNDVKEDTLLSSSGYGKYINTLNFFSAADLSQCIYNLEVNSEIPIEMITINFDLPIGILNRNIISEWDSNSFTINNIGQENYKKEYKFHISFPTFANFQLIRSLILTTLLTSLLSLFFKNLYYYCRKLYEKQKRKHKNFYSHSKITLLLWVPIGKIILWTFIYLFTYLLILSILGYYISINEESVTLVKYKLIIYFLVYVFFINGIFYFLYKKGIYLKNIRDKVVKTIVWSFIIVIVYSLFVILFHEDTFFLAPSKVELLTLTIVYHLYFVALIICESIFQLYIRHKYGTEINDNAEKVILRCYILLFFISSCIYFFGGFALYFYLLYYAGFLLVNIIVIVLFLCKLITYKRRKLGNDINKSCKKNYIKRIKIQIQNYLNKTIYSEKENKEAKPSPEAEEKVEETSKIEESTSNEITIQKDAQKPSKQPSRPKKRKFHKRRK